MNVTTSRNTPRVVAKRLRLVSAQQHGVVHVRNLGEVRVHRDAAFRRVRSGEWVRMCTGVYRVASIGKKSTVHQRMIAATLAAQDSVIIGWHAAHVHGLPVSVDLDRHEVVVALPKGRRSTVVKARRLSGPLPSRPWETGRVANPILTIVTLAAGRATRAQLETVLDAALTRRLVTVKRIDALLQEPGWRRFGGRPLVVSLLDERAGRVTALFRSKTERKVKRWIDSANLPSSVANFVVKSATGDVEVDRAWESKRVALEISPFWTHGSRKKQERDLDRRQSLLAARWQIVEADDRHLDNARSFQPIIDLLTKLLTG